MKKITYNIDEFNFKQLIQNKFKIHDLENLTNDIELIKRETDQSTRYHKMFYELVRTEEFDKLYKSFIKNIILPLYGEQIVYQSIPTFRIAFPNNIAVGEWHKDKQYRDIEWAEGVKEDNFFLPITNAFDTNTIWVESEEDKGDYFPMDCNYGEFIQWDGSNLTHGNKINNTGKTRISFDFRVIRYFNYRPSDHGSINTNTKFALGGYYDLM
jgi:hypothetical protein